MWKGKLFARQSLACNYIKLILVKRNPNEKSFAKPSKSEGFATPRKYTSLVEKLLGPMNFDEKKYMGINSQKSQLSWKKNYLMGGEFHTKSYVGNTPQIIVF
jgi:hypothetical protein